MMMENIARSESILGQDAKSLKPKSSREKSRDAGSMLQMKRLQEKHRPLSFAEYLGVNRTTLYRALEKFLIMPCRSCDNNVFSEVL